MLFQWEFGPGRSDESTRSLLPVSSHTVLSSVNPWGMTTSGSSPVLPHGTVTSTDSGSPSKLGANPRQITYRTGSSSLLVSTVGESSAPAMPANGMVPSRHGLTAWRG